MTGNAELSPYYNGTGTPWWQGPFGGERRIAAYLYFNVEVGGTFTMREIREGLGRDGVPDNAEHLNRRLRNLRKQGWVFPSYKDQAGQDIESYVLKVKGNKLWLGEQTKHAAISDAIKRQLFERDHSRCVLCGVGAGEPYPGEPGTAAKLTAGHRTAGARSDDVSLDNLRTECSRCNEPSGDTPPNPEVLAEVMASVKRLGAADKATLLAWLDSGHRQRNRVDMAYDRIKGLAQSEQEQMVQFLRSATGS